MAFYLLTYKSGRDAHLNIDIFKISESFFAFIGANQSVFRMFVVKLSTIWGVFITGFLGYFIIKNLWFMTIKNKIQTHPHIIRLLALFCFIVFTSGIIALMRSWSGVPLASRYQSYAAISSIIVYLVALSYLKKEWRKYLGIFSLLTTFFFYINSYHFYTQAVDAKVKILTADSFNWKHHNTMFCVSQQFINNANQFIKPAYNQDLWKLSNPFLDIESSLLKPYVIGSDSFDSTKYQINIEPYTEPIGIWFRYYLKIQNNDIPFTKKTGADALFLILKEEKSNQTYLVGTTSNVSTRREVISGSFFNYFKQGFTALAPLANIQEGNYRLGYLTINNKVKTIKFTNTFIPIRTPSLNMKSL